MIGVRVDCEKFRGLTNLSIGDTGCAEPPVRYDGPKSARFVYQDEPARRYANSESSKAGNHKNSFHRPFLILPSVSLAFRFGTTY